MTDFREKRCTRGDSTKNSTILTYDAGADLSYNDIVTLDPSDPSGNTVIPYTGAVGEKPIGYVIKNRTGSKSGDCVNIQLDELISKCVDEAPSKLLDLKLVPTGPDTCELSYCDLDGNVKTVALDKFFDDTNLPFINDGEIDCDTGVLTLTRNDDSVAVTVDLSCIKDSDCLKSPDGNSEVCIDDNGCLVNASLTTTTPITNAEGYLGYDANGGIKPVALPDQIQITCKQLCDAGSDNKPYILETTHNLTQGTKTAATYELDGSTAYTPVEPSVFKPEQCFFTKIWVADLSNVPAGVTEEYWDTNGTGLPEPSGTSQASSIRTVFSAQDSCGVPVHPASLPEGSVPDQVNILPVFQNTDPTDATLGHQNCLTTWLYVPEDNTRINILHAGVASSEVYFGVCNGKLGQVFMRLNNTGSEDVGYLNKGFYQVKGFVHDPNQGANLILRWELPSGSQMQIPSDYFFQEMPALACKDVIVKKGDSSYYELDSETQIDSDLEIFTCDPCNNIVPFSPYVATFEAEEEKPECFIDTVWCFDTTGEKGVREEYWDTDGTGVGGPVSTSMTPDVPSVFSGRDACNYPVHPNELAPDQVNILTSFNSTDPSTGGLAHQNILETYVYIPQDGTELLVSGGGASSKQTYIGVCNGKQGLAHERINASGTDSIGFYSRGIYSLRSFVHDPGTFGRIEVRWRLPGAGITAIPIDNLYLDMPPIICRKIFIEKGSSDYTGLDGQPLDPNLECFECNPCENPAPFLPGGIDEVKSAVVAGDERVTIDAGTAASTAALTPPEGANGAIIQVIIDDPDERIHCINYTTNGANATASRGYQAGHKDFIYLGCKSGNGVDAVDLATEITNFDWHKAEVTSGDVSLEVTYYQC